MLEPKDQGPTAVLPGVLAEPDRNSLRGHATDPGTVPPVALQRFAAAARRTAFSFHVSPRLQTPPLLRSVRAYGVPALTGRA